MSAAPSLQSSIATQGFHFTLSTTVTVPAPHTLDSCSFYLLYDLDPHVYADQYELAQRPGYTSLLWGTSDLERPVSAVDQKGTVLLITADNIHVARKEMFNFTLDVPLHARYGRPTQFLDTSFHHIDLTRPIGFFACNLHSESELSHFRTHIFSLDNFNQPPVPSLISCVHILPSLDGHPYRYL